MKFKMLFFYGLFLLLPLNVNASVMVDINDVKYNIVTMEGTAVALLAELESQVWWGDRDLAKEFAETIKLDAGSQSANDDGPFFAFRTFDNFIEFMFWDTENDRVSFPSATSDMGIFVYAKATPVPVPAALWLFISAILSLGYLNGKVRS